MFFFFVFALVLFCFVRLSSSEVAFSVPMSFDMGLDRFLFS